MIQTTWCASHLSLIFIRRSAFQTDMFCERPLQACFWRYAKHCAGIINLYNILFWEFLPFLPFFKRSLPSPRAWNIQGKKRFIFTSFKRFHIKTKRNSITREYGKAHKHEKYAIIDAFLIFFSRGFLCCVVKLTLNAIFARERLLCIGGISRGEKGDERESKGRRAKW